MGYVMPTLGSISGVRGGFFWIVLARFRP